ncbi:MAG: hypothetical protein AB7E55_12480 [Pigmentiphaga sp.]
MKKFFSTAAIMTFLLLGWSAESKAAPEPMPPGNPWLSQLAEMGGAVQAGIELCDMGHDTTSAKQQQQAQFIQMGGTPEQFEMAYQTGYDRAQSEFEAANVGERQRMCNEYRKLESIQPSSSPQ